MKKMGLGSKSVFLLLALLAIIALLGCAVEKPVVEGAGEVKGEEKISQFEKLEQVSELLKLAGEETEKMAAELTKGQYTMAREHLLTAKNAVDEAEKILQQTNVTIEEEVKLKELQVAIVAFKKEATVANEKLIELSLGLTRLASADFEQFNVELKKTRDELEKFGSHTIKSLELINNISVESAPPVLKVELAKEKRICESNLKFRDELKVYLDGLEIFGDGAYRLSRLEMHAARSDYEAIKTDVTEAKKLFQKAEEKFNVLLKSEFPEIALTVKESLEYAQLLRGIAEKFEQGLELLEQGREEEGIALLEEVTEEVAQLQWI